jgi:hypothetical protein
VLCDLPWFDGLVRVTEEVPEAMLRADSDRKGLRSPGSPLLCTAVCDEDELDKDAVADIADVPVAIPRGESERVLCEWRIPVSTLR